VLPGVTVVLEAGRSRQVATTGADGSFALSNVPAGDVTMTAQLSGFASASRSFFFDKEPQQVDFLMPVGSLPETITVTGESRGDEKKLRAAQAAAPAPPSVNVVDLQRKTVGVLPVRVDVPRAGTSHRFVKPLVVDQAATVSFSYKRR